MTDRTVYNEPVSTLASSGDATAYHYVDASARHTQNYLLPMILQILNERRIGAGARIFELGCGNGSLAAALARSGYEISGVDPSEEGIAIAADSHPHIRLERGSAYDDLRQRYGTFPVVISMEVVEHLYAPRLFARTVFELLQPGGLAIISTPYHGYIKNLALALTGRLDAHFAPLWDHGHIKFWSIRTLGSLLSETGFIQARFVRVGRIPPLAKSMIAIARRPDDRLDDTLESTT
jgi:2-polyprenyl-3-methyl-5-hydroxy-6-metoxy-1,4-benzoquinol methylase